MIEESILRGCAVRVYKIKLKGKKDMWLVQWNAQNHSINKGYKVNRER